MQPIPTTAQAAVLTELNKPLLITPIELPRTLGVGQVLVEVAFSGICGSQLGEIDGVKGPDPFLPHLLGHEGSGTVRAVGPGVKRVRPGDAAVLHWRQAPGIESDPPQYAWEGGRLNAGRVTTFNEWAVVSENRLTPLPDAADLEVAALLGCAVTTGFGAIQYNAGVRIGESVAVVGAGGVGLCAIQAAALVAAHPIVAVDLHDNRLALAKALGATHAVNAARTDARAAILDIVGDAGLDVLVDNTGLPANIEMGYAITRDQGRVVLVGVPRQGADIALHSLPLHFGKVLSGSHGGETAPQRDIPRYHRLYRAGRLDLRRLISDIYPLAAINEAIAAMRSGQTSGRCLIRMR